jgi:hypothetical protein
MFVLFLHGTLFADSLDVLYPGWRTTLNGKPVYFSVKIVAGDHIQTAQDESAITFSGVELEIAPNSSLVLGDEFVLDCGTVMVRSGRATIGDGKRLATLGAGEILHSASPGCGDSLPDAPSAVRNEHNFFSSHKTAKRYERAPPTAVGGLYGDFTESTWPFWTVNGAMFGSSLVTAELTHKCLEAGACTSVPDAFHPRRVMLELGVPALLGVYYLDHYLKSKGKRWWFVPPALIIAGDVVVSEHAARYSDLTGTSHTIQSAYKSAGSNLFLPIKP